MAGPVPFKAFRFFRPSPQKLIAEIRGLQGVSFIDTQNQYRLLGCECGHDHSSGYKLSAGDDLASELVRIVEEIWERKGMPKRISKKLIAYYGKHLLSGVEKGYGQKLSEIDYDTPDGNMLEHLAKNVYHFSAAKTYTQLQQLTQALIGDDGKLRNYNQFKKAAFDINDAHVNQWLKAEYELAVGGAQMASKWIDITGNPATTILEFDVVMDSKTSDICRPLHGIRRLVSDPIFKKYYPPNHFWCRTTIRQHTGGSVTPDSQIELPEIHEMFQVNLAERKIIFPPGHSYWVGTPSAVLKEALDLMPNNSWHLVENKTIRIHAKVDTTAPDFEKVMEVARDKAKNGSSVDLLPTLNHENDPLYKELFKGAKPGKCPDLKIDNEFVEVKAPKKNTINTLKHSIDNASKQADHVIILNPIRNDYKEMKRIAKGRFKDHENLKIIEFKQQGAYYRFTREGQLK